MQEFIENGIHYILTRSKRRSWSISIKVQTDLKVKITSHPRMPVFIVKQLLKTKESWVRRHIALMAQRPKPVKRVVADGGTVVFFGRSYPIKIAASMDVLLPKVELIENVLTITVPEFFDNEKRKIAITKSVEKWLMNTGKKKLIEKARYFAGKIHSTFNELKIKKVSSIWGSCSYDQNLSFNRKLLYAPEKVVDYVVIHEICHLRYKHHGDSFWQCVEKLDLDYKAHRAWLRKNSTTLEVD